MRPIKTNYSPGPSSVDASSYDRNPSFHNITYPSPRSSPLTCARTDTVHQRRRRSTNAQVVFPRLKLTFSRLLPNQLQGAAEILSPLTTPQPLRSLNPSSTLASATAEPSRAPNAVCHTNNEGYSRVSTVVMEMSNSLRRR